MKLKHRKQLAAATLALLFPVFGKAVEAVTPAGTAGGNPAIQAAALQNDHQLADAGAQQDAAPPAGDEDLSYPEEELPFLDEDETEINVYDPLEKFNRGMFWFNDKLYFYVLKPVARGLRYLPEPWRVSVKNFFQNLRAPVRIINAGLQGKFSDAGNELTRFATNTTLGIGGLFDPAKEHFGIRQKDEDTGQTLGHYGVGPGPYLVLPFLGPSDVRDGIGLLADTRMDLAYYIWGRNGNYDYIAAVAVNEINKLSLDKDTYEGIKKDTLDPYLFIRDAYAQYRQNLVDN